MPHSEPVRLAFPDGRRYEIVFAALQRAPELLASVGLPAARCLVVTDETVAQRHLPTLVDALERASYAPSVHILPAGEGAKSLDVLAAIYDRILSGEPPSRDTPLLALGGGAVGDVAGFAAATLLRGLPLVHLPTTLLAQVDSSIGGKTAVNHPAGKNLIGAVYQPRLVIADPTTLRTLPDREWFSGLAEAVKAALIADDQFAGWLEDNWSAVATRHEPALADIVHQAASIKADIVVRDELEAGPRALLNFGHTFGHAIEKATGFNVYTHGEAVALGMRAALRLSELLTPGFDAARSQALVERIPIPAPLDLPVGQLTRAMQADKKRIGSRRRLVVLDRVGAARVVVDPPEEAVEAAWRQVVQGS